MTHVIFGSWKIKSQSEFFTRITDSQSSIFMLWLFATRMVTFSAEELGTISVLLRYFKTLKNKKM